MIVILAIAAGLAASALWVRARRASVVWAYAVHVALLAAFIATSATTSGAAVQVAAGAVLGPLMTTLATDARKARTLWARRHAAASQLER